MNRDERKRKFNEAIVNMLYPSPPQPEPPSSQLEEELEPMAALMEGFGSDVISDTLDDYENASTSGDAEHDSEREKPTRAQRKKIRKKKLKEEAISRGKLIGPLLPPTTITSSRFGDPVAEAAPAVRSNASQEDSGFDEPGFEPAGANSKKVKHRRMAKRLAKEKRIASASEKCSQHSTSSSGADPSDGSSTVNL